MRYLSILVRRIYEYNEQAGVKLEKFFDEETSFSLLKFKKMGNFKNIKKMSTNNVKYNRTV